MTSNDVKQFISEHPIMMENDTTEIVLQDNSSYFGYFLFPFATPIGSNIWKFVTYNPNNPITIDGDSIVSITILSAKVSSFK
jgi:hypothetical protein